MLISEIKRRGMSQREIAAEIGVSHSVVTDLKNRRPRPPSWPVGDKLIRLYERVLAKGAGNA